MLAYPSPWTFSWTFLSPSVTPAKKGTEIWCLLPLTQEIFVIFITGLWEDPNVIAWDEPESIRLNKKVYECTDDMGCGCPMLLCTGEKTCERHNENPIKCQLTEPYENIDLNNAKTGFFVKGDCKCNPL